MVAICATLALSSCMEGADTTIAEDSTSALSTGGGLKGEYYSGAAFETLVLTRTDATVNFDWLTSAPGTGVPAERFSVRWTGQVEALYSETYTFYTQSDDGIRLWVNGQQLVNNWTDHASAENSATIALTAGQRYDIKIEYHESTGLAVAKLSWASPRTAKQIVPQSQLYPPATAAVCGTADENNSLTLGCPSGQNITSVGFASYGTPSGTCGAFATSTCNAATSAAVVSSACVGKASCTIGATNGAFGDPCPGTYKRLYAQVVCGGGNGGSGGGAGSGGSGGSGGSVAPGSGTGLRGEYYNLASPAAPALVRTDAKVDFDWQSGSPGTGVGADQFSVRWTGQVQPLYSQSYTFYTRSDDGIRLTIGGQQVIDNWTDHGPTENSGAVTLVAGQKYDLVLEYYEAGGGALATLSWSSAGQAKQIIPQSQLYPAPGSLPPPPPSGGGGSTGGGGSNGGGATTGRCGANSTLQLVGNRIHDTSGTPVVTRGAEMVVAATSHASWIDASAAMGANAVRLLLTLDTANGMTPASFDALVARAASHKMIVWISLYTWDSASNHVIGSSLGGGNFYSLAAPAGTGTCSKTTPAPCYLAVWSRQWLKDLVAKYKGHIIVDAMQEYIGVAAADSEAGRTEWAESAKTNIKWFRGAGYTVPLEVMSNFQGRDLYAIVQKGASIRAVDTLLVDGQPQTLFGWQAYWADNWYKQWQGSLLLGAGNTITGTQALHQFAVTQPFPIQIGFDNYGGDTGSEYKAQMDQAAADKASWLWWSWRDNGLEAPVDGSACQSYVASSQNGFAGAVRSACGI